MSDRPPASYQSTDTLAVLDRAPSLHDERGPAPRLPGRARRWLARPGVLDATIATFAVLLIASPLLFTRNGFAPDFTNAIWLSSYQQHFIAAHLHPTLFLQTQRLGVFYPLFAFYGGTLFAITGALGAALGGSTMLAFEVITIAAIAAAYGGLFWLARQLGVRGVLAHAPALVFVTSAYYATNLYGRGAWAEFMAVSALPLVLAASLRLVRGRWRVGPVLCLVAATTVFSGSHNITFLWGSGVAAAGLVVYWLLSGRSRELPWRRMLAVAGLIVLGVALNGWFLLPDVSYAHDTIISRNEIPWSATGFFNTFGVIFDPLRLVPSESTTPALYVQAPVLALVWSLVMLPLVWRERRLRAGVTAVLVVLAGLLLVVMSEAVYELLPSLFRQIQFAYRLQTYVTLACAGLVLVGTVALTRRAQSGRATRVDRRLTLGLGLVVVFGVALSAWQLWVPNTRIHESYFSSYENRDAALAGPPAVLPTSWNASNNYGDRGGLPVIAAKRSIGFNPEAVDDDRFAGSALFPPGRQPFATNIDGGPYLVHVGGGLRIAGQTPEGMLVLERTTNGSGRIPFEVSTELSAPVVLGQIVTAAAAALLLALAAIAAVRWWRRRSAAHS